jgi:hypothetical protein
MVERRQELGLPPEAADPFGIVHDVVRKHLDGHIPLEPGVARTVDLAHAPRAERRDDFVDPQAPADVEAHRRDVSWSFLLRTREHPVSLADF